MKPKPYATDDADYEQFVTKPRREGHAFDASLDTCVSIGDLADKAVAQSEDYAAGMQGED